jgi:hypothetical protein
MLTSVRNNFRLVKLSEITDGNCEGPDITTILDKETELDNEKLTENLSKTLDFFITLLKKIFYVFMQQYYKLEFCLDYYRGIKLFLMFSFKFLLFKVCSFTPYIFHFLIKNPKQR